MKEKIDRLLAQLADVESALGDPDVYKNQSRFRELTQKHSYLTELQSLWSEQQKVDRDIQETREMLKEAQEASFDEMLKAELETLENKREHIQSKLQSQLIPPDPKDNYNAILELRAGTGGEEAALFVADCARMYKMYADRQGWRYELLSCTPSDMGGYKEYVMVLSGKGVYRLMKYEGGTHRVQRIPETEAQGRVHTSAITVAVLLEPEEQEDIDLDEKDLRVDTYRSSGAGGQHVNTTDSAVRITHLPSGIVAYCQEERSQLKNKEKALRLLKAKIREIEEAQRAKEIASNRAQQVGTGDRSERIRTYNFPQNRVTDHRIQLTRYHLDQIIEGDLEDFSLALVAHFQGEGAAP